MTPELLLQMLLERLTLSGSGESQVGGLLLAQEMTNTGFPCLSSPVVLQWPDEAV